jgi:hypothetical protein
MKKLPILKECALVRRISQTSVKRVNVDIKFEIILVYFYGKKKDATVFKQVFNCEDMVIFQLVFFYIAEMFSHRVKKYVGIERERYLNCLRAF